MCSRAFSVYSSRPAHVLLRTSPQHLLRVRSPHRGCPLGLRHSVQNQIRVARSPAAQATGSGAGRTAARRWCVFGRRWGLRRPRGCVKGAWEGLGRPQGTASLCNDRTRGTRDCKPVQRPHERRGAVGAGASSMPSLSQAPLCPDLNALSASFLRYRDAARAPARTSSRHEGTSANPTGRSRWISRGVWPRF